MKMKKLIIGFASVVFASMIQAAQITWTAASIQAVGGGSIGATGSGFAFTGTAADRDAVIALLGTATWASDFSTYQSSLVNSQTVTDSSIAANSNVALGGGSLTTSSSLLASTVAYGTTAANAFVGSTEQSVFFVVFDNTDWTQATYYTVSELNTQTLTATGAKQYTTLWANWDGTGVAGTWTAVVPEPTSMALLALGVVAVGLRRRFRK